MIHASLPAAMTQRDLKLLTSFDRSVRRPLMANSPYNPPMCDMCVCVCAGFDGLVGGWVPMCFTYQSATCSLNIDYLSNGLVVSQPGVK